LTSANWQVHPEIVEALCKAATDDPAPTVRARCAHCLAQMEIRSAKALDTIHKLQADKDEAVRAQADEAHRILQPGEITHE
jgi:HEAT repeat protein